MTIHLLIQKNILLNGVGAYLRYLGDAFNRANVDYRFYQLYGKNAITVDEFMRLRGPRVVVHTSKDVPKADQEALAEAGCWRVLHATFEHDDAPGMESFPDERTIVIREAILKRFPGAIYIPHPYTMTKPSPWQRPWRGISIARVAAVKQTKKLLEATEYLRGRNVIQIYGATDRIYRYFALTKNLPNPKAWAGWNAEKPYKDGEETGLAGQAEILFNLARRKGDGGGSEYAMLEGLNSGCLIAVDPTWMSFPDPILEFCTPVANPLDIIELMFSGRRGNLNASRDYLREHHDPRLIAELFRGTVA